LPVPKDKSVAVALVLSLVFGPLGLLYVEVVPALVLLAILVVAGFLTLGIAVPFIWLLTVVFSGLRAGQKHSDFMAYLAHARGECPGHVASARPPDDRSREPLLPGSPLPGPAWFDDPGDPRLLRWWDGSRWTEHTSPRWH